MPDDKQNGLLHDILDSALAIRGNLDGVSRDAFLANVEKQDPVLRRFEIIGEAASRLSPATQSLFPNLPFREMRGMRNIIPHDYGDVQIELVWNAAAKDLDELIAILSRHFGKASS